MKQYILTFNEIKNTDMIAVGGKGLNLGKLAQIDGVYVPDGFCVTTQAYQEAIANNAELQVLFAKLDDLKVDERQQISEVSGHIRAVIESLTMDTDLEEEITNTLSVYGADESYAIRSSATAEDLPAASFAGQQDTYLNIRGQQAIIQHVIKCWASLFTDRAVTYRIKNGFDHRKVLLSVIVQKMVIAKAAGTMFTADPMTSDRRTISIDAGFGLGEGLVSGRVNPDIYKVVNGEIIQKDIGIKEMEIGTSQAGGIEKLKVGKARQKKQVLANDQIQRLAAIGKKIENYFGAPQDVEWCLVNKAFFILQSRAITTLYPLPDTGGLATPRVYMSIGHTQMMTDTMKPLGISVFSLISPIKMDHIGGRMYIDVTHDLSSAIGRIRIVFGTGQKDPFMRHALKNLLADKAFMESLPKGKRNLSSRGIIFASLAQAIPAYWQNDPAIIKDITDGFDQELSDLDEQLSRLSGEEALKFIFDDRDAMRTMTYNPTILGAIMVALLANESINKQVEKLLGERKVTDTLIKSLPHNVTTQMGFDACDLSDVIRQYPQVQAYLASHPDDETFFEKMAELPGGKESSEAFQKFLAKYGMRCPGEIDITRDRFAERPTQLIPLILNNIRVLAPGEYQKRFQDGKEEAEAKRDEIIRQVKKLPGGNKQAKKLAKQISLLRNFMGYREEPKYYIIKRLQVYKKALIKEGQQLAEKDVIKETEDIFYLFMDELREVVKTHHADYAVIEKRQKDYARYEKLTPPRIFTSDGFVPPMRSTAAHLPEGVISGIPVSSGIVEGRARVVSSISEANFEAGDILVTQFTDPSWTPFFVTIKGLVTEVGGFTTHGAIIAREYGLPGVVGVENATKLIKEGQMIRVNGTEGYVELL